MLHIISGSVETYLLDDEYLGELSILTGDDIKRIKSERDDYVFDCKVAVWRDEETYLMWNFFGSGIGDYDDCIVPVADVEHIQNKNGILFPEGHDSVGWIDRMMSNEVFEETGRRAIVAEDMVLYLDCIPFGGEPIRLKDYGTVYEPGSLRTCGNDDVQTVIIDSDVEVDEYAFYSEGSLNFRNPVHFMVPKDDRYLIALAEKLEYEGSCSYEVF